MSQFNVYFQLHIFQSLKVELEKVKSKEKEVMERMEEDAKDLEKMASKQTLLHQKIDDCSKKIRDLGSLPSEAFDKYQVSINPDFSLAVGFLPFYRSCPQSFFFCN